MTTHRRAWKQRAGVVVALVVGAVFALPASPALAAPSVNNVSASPSSVGAGGTTRVTYTLKFQGGPLSLPADVTVSSSNPKLTCTDGCSRTKVTDDGQSTATFKLASDLEQNAEATITIKAVDAEGEEQASTRVTLIGKPKVRTVKEISGKVTNQNTGDPVPGALVIISDSENHRYEVTTGSSGGFRFTGSEQKPITPGSIQIGAAKDDIQTAKTINVAAGQSFTGYKLTLALAAPTPTATEAEPTTDPTIEETTEATESVQAEVPTGTNEDSGGMGSLLLILVGGLLVALGVGAIVLLWMRRKENDEDGEEGVPAGAGGAAHGRRGAYAGADDATRMTNRAGAGADPTMVGHPSLADAPTMLHGRPLVEEFPDPYGAPLPPPQPQGPPQPPPYGQPGWAGNGYGGAPTQAGYGAGAPGYGNAPSSGGGYGGPPSSGGGGYGGPAGSHGGYGNAPASGGGYGDPAGGHGGYGNAPASGGGYGGPGGRPEAEGYGARDYGATGPQSGPGYGRQPGGGYDEPTGRHDGGGGGGYGQPPYQSGSHSQPSDPGRGYGPEQQYGQDARQGHGGGYDPDGGYASGGGYDQSGYGSGPAGYDQSASGGYDQRGGYDRVPEQRDGGYDARGYDQGGYYDEAAQGGGRRGAPPEPTRAERRSLDWLDD